MLTPDQVHRIRTEGLTDAFFARLYGVSRSHIRQIRIGEAYPEHPTPPDTRKRMSVGRYGAARARFADPLPQDIVSHALKAWRPITAAIEPQAASS